MADELPLDLERALGVSGLRQYGGVIDEEFLAKLRGRLGVQVFKEMAENDPVCGASLYVITTLLRQVQWWFEPSDAASPASREEAEWAESARQDMSHSWEDLIDEILSMLVYGWSYFEIVYKLRKGETPPEGAAASGYDDGRFGWRKIEIRGQDTLDRWEFDAENGLRGMWQTADTITGLQTPVLVPIEKSLLFRPKKHKNNPEGRSILRSAVRSCFMTKRIQEIEAIGIERDLAGLPMIECPQEILSTKANDEQKALRRFLESMVQQIRRDEREGLLFPTSERTDSEGRTVKTGFKLSLLSSGGKRQIDTNQIINRWDQRTAMTILTEFLFLGMQDSAGNRSLASSKTSIFASALGTYLDAIAAVFNRFAVPRIMRLNNVPKELWPKLTHGDVEAPPLDEVGKLITDMANAGFVLSNNKPLERKLLGFAKLPVPVEDVQDVEEA